MAMTAPPWRESLAFRQFHVGFLACRIGEWHYLVALNWAVLTLTNSPLMLGLVNACRLVPALLMSLPSGVLADRFERRRLLYLIYGTMAVLTGIVGLLVSHHAPIWTIAVAVFVRELANTAEPPVRNAFLSDLERRDLSRALAVNAMVLNYGRLLGPPLAGFFMVAAGAWLAFGVATASLALGALLTVLLKGVQSRETFIETCERTSGGLGEAVSYIRSEPRLKLLILLMVGPMLLAFPYIPMLPLFAKEVLHLEADGLGALLSLTALGSMLGSVYVAGNSHSVMNGRFQVLALLGFSASLVGLALAPSFWLAGASVLCAGLLSQAYRTVSRILAQAGVPKRLHGRVVSIILMDRGLIPLGTVVIGWWAQMFGAVSAGLAMGLGSAVCTLLLLLLYPQIWRIGPAPPTPASLPLEELAVPEKILPPGPG